MSIILSKEQVEQKQKDDAKRDEERRKAFMLDIRALEIKHGILVRPALKQLSAALVASFEYVLSTVEKVEKYYEQVDHKFPPHEKEEKKAS